MLGSPLTTGGGGGGGGLERRFTQTVQGIQSDDMVYTAHAGSRYNGIEDEAATAEDLLKISQDLSALANQMKSPGRKNHRPKEEEGEEEEEEEKEEEEDEEEEEAEAAQPSHQPPHQPPQHQPPTHPELSQETEAQETEAQETEAPQVPLAQEPLDTPRDAYEDGLSMFELGLLPGDLDPISKTSPLSPTTTADGKFSLELH